MSPPPLFSASTSMAKLATPAAVCTTTSPSMIATLAGTSASARHDDGEALGPVEPLPAEQRYPAVLQMGLQAIAVMLDLVQPAAA